MDEVKQMMRDLRRSWGADILTVGYYLQPSKKHLAMQKYYTMEEFAELNNFGMEIGFKWIKSHPLVCSSYIMRRSKSAHRVWCTGSCMGERSE